MKAIIKEPESKVVKHNNYRKNAAITIIIILCLLVCTAVIIVPMIHDRKIYNEQSGGTLPGADKIYPSVMYNGTVYRWKQMAGPENELPQGELPEGYKYVGDIEYINTGKLAKDFQFIAVFIATGHLYINDSEPDSICICITTPWLDNAYVIFQHNA